MFIGKQAKGKELMEGKLGAKKNDYTHIKSSERFKAIFI